MLHPIRVVLVDAGEGIASIARFSFRRPDHARDIDTGSNRSHLVYSKRSTQTHPPQTHTFRVNSPPFDRFPFSTANFRPSEPGKETLLNVAAAFLLACERF
jgi:hypothetical protein